MAIDFEHKRGPLHRVLGGILLILMGLTLGLLACEVGLRVLGIGQPGFYTYDRARGWTLRPDASGWQRKEGAAFMRVDTEGLRGPEVSEAKPARTLRIAFLGDSFTEAKQVPERQTFCAVTQRALSACPALAGRQVQALNFGCDSYGTGQELMTERTQIWKFAPDVVVLDFFSGNDVRNNSFVLEGDKCQPFFVVRAGKLVPVGEFEGSAVFRAQCAARFDSQSSALLNFAGQLRSEWRAHRRAAAALRAQPLLRAVPGVEAGLDPGIYAPPQSALWRQAWQTTEAEIEALDQDTHAHGAMFLAVTLTNGIQVWPDPTVRAEFMKRLGLTDLFYPDRRIAALARRGDFPVLNLAAPMQQYADAHRVFLHGFANTTMGHGHLNQNGHALAGELIAARICAMLSQAPSKSR